MCCCSLGVGYWCSVRCIQDARLAVSVCHQTEHAVYTSPLLLVVAFVSVVRPDEKHTASFLFTSATRLLQQQENPTSSSSYYYTITVSLQPFACVSILKETKNLAQTLLLPIFVSSYRMRFFKITKYMQRSNALDMLQFCRYNVMTTMRFTIVITLPNDSLNIIIFLFV